MKKTFTLFLLLTIGLFKGAFAQPGTVCNAEFAYTVTDSTNNTVQFTPTVVDASAVLQHLWQFGDGAAEGSIRNPSHTYSQPGIYTVLHFVEYRSPNDSNIVVCSDSFYLTITIGATSACNLQAYYYYTIDSLQQNPPFVVYFTNASVNTDSSTTYYWTFSDGSIDNNPNPVHTFSDTGWHYVCLYISKIDSISGDTCRSQYCNSIYLQNQQPQPCNLQAYYYYTIDSLQQNPPFVVYFTNASVNTDSLTTYYWTFSDGSIDNNPNPVHTFSDTGWHYVCLYVSKIDSISGDTCRSQYCNSIYLQNQQPQPCNLQASYNYHVDTLAATPPYIVLFENTSVNADSSTTYFWNFGDGSMSNEQNPIHTFRDSGYYRVCLTIANPVTGNDSCRSEYCSYIYIQGQQTPCNIHSNFSYTIADSVTHQVNFTNLTFSSTPDTLTYWNFGDGNTSYANSPVHFYSSPGTYRVCLVVSSASNCVSDTCIMVEVPGDSITCNLVANFTSSRDSVSGGFVYNFINQSLPYSPTDTLTWNFGDGNTSSGLAQNLSYTAHTYSTPGLRRVCLRVKKQQVFGMPACISEYCDSINIQQIAPCITPAFNYNRDTTNMQVLSYNFNNTTNGLNLVDSSFWDFGDNTPIVINPNNPFDHIFASPGSYNVCLTVKKMLAGTTTVICERRTCQAIVVQAPVDTCNIAADFAFAIDSSNYNKVNFVNTSINTVQSDSLIWNFGDGTMSSLNNPAHIYTTPGTYNVCLRVFRRPMWGGAPCVSEACKVVVITAQTVCDIVPAFTFQRDSSSSIFSYSFTNTTLNLNSSDSSFWYFSDNTVVINPTTNPFTHIFAAPGIYTVVLKIKRSMTIGICERQIIQTIQVIDTTNNCNLLTSFRWERDAIDSNKIHFINNSINYSANRRVMWYFGDGTSDTSWNPVHSYQTPGYHLACVTITNNNNCSRTSCDSVVTSIIANTNCNNLTASFNYHSDYYMPNKYYFFANANGNVVNQQWAFIKLTNGIDSVIVNENNPSHVFSDTGLYKVCLKATFANGCIIETCEFIHVNTLATSPNCVLLAYPNPAQTTVSVNVELQQPLPIIASVFNMQNELMFTQTQPGFTGNNVVRLNVDNLVSGVYTIRLVYGNNVCYARFQKL